LSELVASDCPPKFFGNAGLVVLPSYLEKSRINVKKAFDMDLDNEDPSEEYDYSSNIIEIQDSLSPIKRGMNL